MADFRLEGMGVAMVTPFREDKSIDTEALDRLIDHIVDGGADFIVVLGTTAETPTLTPAERDFVARHTVGRVAGRIPLVIGIGGNCTDSVCAELKGRDLSGYSAVLSVVPYYNKPSQEGIFSHYTAIADASPLPVILYNVPGRTGVKMTADTTLRLASHPNIMGIKEASGDFALIETIIKHAPEGFGVISGDDGITFPLVSLGATGVISVLGNVCPAQFAEMVHLSRGGKMQEARKLHHNFAELFQLLFADGNPAGAKCALGLMGICSDVLRLPLVKASDKTRDALRCALNDAGVTTR